MTARRLATCALVVVFALGAAPPALAGGCPTTTDPGAIAGARALKRLNAVMWRLGPRPTGSPSHRRFVGWLESRLRAVPGVRVRSLRYPIRRRVSLGASLTVELGGRRVALPVAAPVPYAAPTPRGGTTGPLVLVPEGEAITRANAAGRIVVRPAPAGAVPLSLFASPLLAWSAYDPDGTLDSDAPFTGDFLSYDQRARDLRDAGVAGAAGVVFLKDLPRRQLRGHLEPYEGLHWRVPAVFLGAEERRRLIGAPSAGTARAARLVLRTRTERVVTRTLLATIPGRSRQRLVVESHTDGVNAIWDNGPLAMLAMARRVAGLPRRCRPRTVQFAFVTGHLHQRLVSPRVRDGGAEQLAVRLDRAFERGGVAAVVVLEHLGAREYATTPVPGGMPIPLRRTGRPELLLVGVTASRPLVRAVRRVVVRHDLRRTALLKGADLEGPHVPAHCSFGGEGGPYNKHLLPTVAAIAAPRTLYNAPFGLEGIDFRLMRDQTLAFSDLLLALGRMPRAAIAGRVLEDRRRRRAGAPACPRDPVLGGDLAGLR